MGLIFVIRGPFQSCTTGSEVEGNPWKIFWE
jgi:hypothetical protein